MKNRCHAASCSGLRIGMTSGAERHGRATPSAPPCRRHFLDAHKRREPLVARRFSRRVSAGLSDCVIDHAPDMEARTVTAGLAVPRAGTCRQRIDLQPRRSGASLQVIWKGCHPPWRPAQWHPQSGIATWSTADPITRQQHRDPPCSGVTWKATPTMFPWCYLICNTYIGNREKMHRPSREPRVFTVSLGGKPAGR